MEQIISTAIVFSWNFVLVMGKEKKEETFEDVEYLLSTLDIITIGLAG